MWVVNRRNNMYEKNNYLINILHNMLSVYIWK